jgi:membrane protease YdiL (CAAX protease family)
VLFAVSGPLGISWTMAGFFAALLVASVLLHAKRASALAATCAWWVAVHCAIPFRVWPSHLVLVIGGAAAAVVVFPGARDAIGWFKRGTIDTATARAMVLFTLVPSIALVAWWRLARPDLAVFRQLVPGGVPIALVFVGIAAIAVLNSISEELIFRGVLLDALDSAFGEGWGTLVAQALVFGLWHFRGFPSGWIGVGLVLVFGTMMGILRRMGRGMWAPWIVHACADLTIYSLVTIIVRVGA